MIKTTGLVDILRKLRKKGFKLQASGFKPVSRNLVEAALGAKDVIENFGIIRLQLAA